MKGKSFAVSIMSVLIAVIASYSDLVSPHVQAWLGIASFTLTLILSSAFFASGSYPTGWTPVLVITNVVGILVQALTQIGDKALVSPSVINYVIIGINILMTGFVKDYGNGGLVGKG